MFEHMELITLLMGCFALLLVLMVVWRQLRTFIAWHVEQRLYSVRDRVYAMVAAKQTTFDDANTAFFIDSIHCWIRLARSHTMRVKWIENYSKQTADPEEEGEEALVESFRKLFTDPLYKDLVREACGHLHKCLVMEMFTRHFLITPPILALLILTFASRRVASASRQWINESLPIASLKGAPRAARC